MLSQLGGEPGVQLISFKGNGGARVKLVSVKGDGGAPTGGTLERRRRLHTGSQPSSQPLILARTVPTQQRYRVDL